MDDDWDLDEEDLEKKLQEQLKEKDRARRRAEGLPSDSEEEEKPKAPEPAAVKQKPKPKPKAKVEAQPEVKLSPQEERLRRRQMEEERDLKLAGDLFSGCDKSVLQLEKEAQERAEEEERARREAAKPKVIVQDEFDKVELKVTPDVEALCEQCVKKIDTGKAKGAALKFIVDMLKQVETQMNVKEFAELEKLVSDVVKEKKAAKGAVDAKANKANTKINKTTKFNASSAWEEVYGGGEGDEDWTQEEWDEWYKSQEAAARG